MADTKVQTQQRGLARREDYSPSRDLFQFDPFAMMRRLSEAMDQAFGSTFGLTREMGRSGMWAPPIEVRQHEDRLDVTAELPGMKKEDIKLECTDEGIILEGEKRREEEKEEGGQHRTERFYGHFYRMIPLPDGADPDKAKAEFKDGVLRVSVPIAENKRRTRRIQVGG